VFQNDSDQSEIIKYYEEKIEEFHKRNQSYFELFLKLINKFSDVNNPNVLKFF